MNITKRRKVLSKVFKKKLKQFDLFFSLRYSSIALKLEKYLFPNLQENKLAERQLYGQIFADNSLSNLVFDVGANLGYSTAIFLENRATVICIEPVEFNLKCLRARFKGQPKVVILDKAVSDQQGVRSIFLQDEGNALHTLNTKWKDFLAQPDNNRWESAVDFSNSTEVKTTTLDQLIAQYGHPFFIKIDVEGHEYEVIKGLSKSVPRLCFEANLPEFLNETIAVVSHLVTLDPSAQFNYSTYDSLLLPEYISANEFISFLRKTKLIYMDVFCKSDAPEYHSTKD